MEDNGSKFASSILDSQSSTEHFSISRIDAQDTPE